MYVTESWCTPSAEMKLKLWCCNHTLCCCLPFEAVRFWGRVTFTWIRHSVTITSLLPIPYSITNRHHSIPRKVSSPSILLREDDQDVSQLFLRHMLLPLGLSGSSLHNTQCFLGYHVTGPLCCWTNLGPCLVWIISLWYLHIWDLQSPEQHRLAVQIPSEAQRP